MAINFSKFIQSNKGTTPVKQEGINFNKFVKASPNIPLEEKQYNLPDFLGGGQFNVGKPGELVKTDRSYAGVEAPGEYREHIFPVALGGSSNVDNIKVYGKKLGEEKSVYENDIIDKYKTGKISLGEARGLVLKKYREITGMDPKQGITANLWGGIKKTFSGTTQAVKDIKESVKTPIPKNPTIQFIKDYAKSIYETDKEEIQRIKDHFSTSVSEVGYAGKASQSIKVLTGAVGVALSPVTALFEAPKNIPVLNTISKVATLPFAVGGDVGVVVTDEALNKLPIKTETKETLREAINEVGALAGQIVIGGTTYMKGKEFLTKKGELIKKFGQKDAETIIKKAQEKASVSTTEKPPMQKIDFNKFISKETKIDPLLTEARKYKSVSESKFGVRFGEETKDRAIQLYKEGKSSTQISKEMGVSSASVLSWTEKAGIKRTISQSKILYEKDIPKVVELYKQGKNTTEISRELNLVPSSVARWVKEAGITRSNSEAQSILAELGKTNVLGVRSKVSTKFGVIPADSTYEAIRIKQLEADPNIVSIKRATRIPFGENRHYIPDIEIKYKNGSTVIEEIKPVYKLGDEKIIAKEKAAKEFYKDKNTEYRIITENDIGVDAFKNANLDNITFGSEEIKLRFLKAINKAKSKTKSQLTDIWNKANKATPEASLLAEAKNYKSAEEFVKAQGTAVYHGGTEIKEVGNMRSKWGAFYMTENPTYAKSYGGNKSVLNEMVITPEAKLADLRKPNANIIKKIDQVISPKAIGETIKIKKPDGSFIEVQKVKGGLSNPVHSSADIIQGIKEGKAYYAEMPEVKQALKKLGYDGMITQESKFGSNYGVWNKDVIKTKSQLTDIWNKANKQETLTLPEQKPIKVFDDSKIKISELARSVEAKAVEQNLTKGFGDLPEYKQLDMAQQAKDAVDYLNKNYESARNIALGLEKPPSNITPEAIFTALENKALKEGDITTIRDLATQSTLSSEATAMGQRIRTLAERNPESPVAAIKDLQAVREKAILAKNKNINTIKKVNMDNIKSEINKNIPKIKTWTDFVDSLKC